MAKRTCDILIDGSGDCTGADVVSALRISKTAKNGSGKAKKSASSGRQKTDNIPSTSATDGDPNSLHQQVPREEDMHGSSLQKHDISLIVSEVLKELRKDSSERSTPTEAVDDVTPSKSGAVRSIIMCNLIITYRVTRVNYVNLKYAELLVH